MRANKNPPEELSERQLLNEFVELTREPSKSLDGYEEAFRQKREAELLAEIGERLETLEAIKSLLNVDTGNPAGNRKSSENPVS